MYLISAYFDNKSNEIMQKLINDIAATTGNLFMIENHVPPHITISSIEARHESVLIPGFDRLSPKLYSGTINFVSIGQFFPYVLFASPVVNLYLDNLSKIIFDEFKDVSETEISKYYQPKSWMPHATLGKKLDDRQMIEAFKIMQEKFRPFQATITEIGLSKVNPHQDIKRILLP